MSCGNGMCGGVGCGAAKIAKILLLVGGVNWGLVGIGYFVGTNLNVVNLVLGSIAPLEAIVYILVGIGAVVKIFGCPCKMCKGSCAGGACSGGTCGGSEMPKM